MKDQSMMIPQLTDVSIPDLVLNPTKVELENYPEEHGDTFPTCGLQSPLSSCLDGNSF
jgi:hypothetical protein